MKKFAVMLALGTLVAGALFLSTATPTTVANAAVIPAPTKIVVPFVTPNEPNNFSSLVHKTNCNGRTGAHGCGPGWIWACIAGGGCRCVRC